MYTMREGPSAELALTLMVFLYLRIASRPLAADLVADLKTAIDDVKAKAQTVEDKRLARRLTTAELTYLDEELDDALSRYVKHLLALLPLGRQDPRYVQMFPVAPSDMTRSVASAAQSRMVKGVLAVHDAEPELAAISAPAEVLRAALDAINAGRAQRVLDYDAEQVAQNALRASLTTARGVYNAAHPRLELAFPGKKGLIRSFFWRDELKKDDPPEAEAEAEDKA